MPYGDKNDKLSITGIGGDARTKAVDIVNQWRANMMKTSGPRRQAGPSASEMLAHYSYYTSDAASGRTTGP